MGYERLAEEALRIADEPCLFDGKPDNALVQKQRLQVDARKWFLSKLLPRQFGDRVTQEITGDGGGALITKIELIPVAPRLRQEELPADGDEAGEVRLFPPRLDDRRCG